MAQLHKIIQEIMDTKEGQERNMYPSIKKIFEFLGHNSKNILVDTSSEFSRGIPDLIVKAPIATTEKNRPIMGDWLVCEVKDERDAFATVSSRKRILIDKSKYITIDTEFFVMIDPVRMVIRPVTPHAQDNFDSYRDIVIEWQDVLRHDAQWFQEQCTPILGKNAGIANALNRFRSGDTSQIAVISLQPLNESKQEQIRVSRARKDFLYTIRRSTQLLQMATKEALNNVEKEITRLEQTLQNFSNKYDGIRKFSIEPFELRGEDVYADNAYEHDRDVEKVRDTLLANPSLAKLTFIWLPEFKSRIGKTKESEKNKVYELFAIETANMILARILLLRFLEDHGFFGEKRYICNGGVKAFQAMKDYFGLSYTKLLKDVYEKARGIYYAVFQEMELDWIFGTNDEKLSNAIEISLMYFSRYDFTTIKGDILTGIYDRFLDGSQRKKLGEYYTKPSIARYIVDRIGISTGDKVLDPACGSGTFLLEVFDKTVGSEIEAGLADYQTVIKQIENIRGNDLNPFSSIITQIQFLWHLLPYKDELLQHGFPKLYIAEKHNSLIPSTLMEYDGSIYFLIDKKEYDAVVGNPPYVRPERNTQELPKEAEEFYLRDIKPDKNLFSLFIYRALQSWCKTEAHLGYVIPLSFCDNNSNAKLRKLFDIGRKWKIVEIVDMETISKHIFDAAVQPIIFIAKNEPATEDDTIIIKIADVRCIDPETGEINLSNAQEESFSYSDIWSREHRILTKINHQRLAIINKLLQHQTFADIAHRFYVKKVGSKIVGWALRPEELDIKEENEQFEERLCISGGIAFRGKKRHIPNGFNVYKGENIAAGMIEGKPAEKEIDILSVDDPSLWKYLHVLPTKGFAFMQICLNITAAPFNPHREAFLNTATLFFPKPSLTSFPFDLLVLSNIYQFFYAIYARMGVVEEFYSHLYPTNLRYLPWTDTLLEYEEDIENLREEYLQVCKAIYDRQSTLDVILRSCGAIEFRELCLQHGAGRENWRVEFHPEELEAGKEEIEIFAIDTDKAYVDDGNKYRIYLSPQRLDVWIEVGDEFVAKSLAAALTIYHGTKLKRTDIIKMMVPIDQDALQCFIAKVQEYDAGNAYQKYDEIVNAIDQMVGAAFGLTSDEIGYIQQEMKEDPFLSQLKPKLPFSGKKKRGLLKPLASSTRYK